jgi:iron complex transport system ATP-binding protein
MDMMNSDAHVTNAGNVMDETKMRKPLLELRDAAIGYQGKTVLSGLTLSVNRGELVVLAGPNGSGKTTLLKTAAGVIAPKTGTVTLFGQNAARMNRRERAGKTAILFQGTLINWPFTVEEIIRQGQFSKRNFWGNLDKNTKEDAENAVREAILEAGLSGYEERLVTEISGGELQRVLIARSIAQGAELLLLDEPVNNLDPKYQNAVMDLVRQMTRHGRGVLVSLHDLNLAALYADRIAFVSQGCIAFTGTPNEILTTETLKQVYGIAMPVGAHISRPAQKIVFPVLPGE